MTRPSIFFILLLFSQLACQPQEKRLEALTERLEQSVDGRVLSARQALGDFGSVSFVREPNFISGPEDSVAVPRGGMSVMFYSSYPLPSELIVEAADVPGKRATDIQISINGEPLSKLQVSQHEKQRFRIDENLITQGRNLVTFSSEEVFLLRYCEVRELGLNKQGTSAQEEATKSEEKVSNLLLPFSSPLEFTWQPEQSEDEFFVVDGFEEWSEQGVPYALTPPRLEVRLQSSEGEVEQTLQASVGQSLRIPLKASAGATILTLVARSGDDPLVGQKGLRLLSPRFEAPKQDSPKVANSASPQAQEALEAEQQEEIKSPNVLVFMVDTLRADHLSCYGYERQTSPNFDKLAEDGVLFKDVTAQAPWTKPSTATLLTGLHPVVHGAVDFGDKLPEEVDTLAELLKERGYRAGAFSANVFASDVYQILQGFESKFTPKGKAPKLLEQALDWLDSGEKDKPFFLYIHSIEPHTPYTPPPEFNKWSKAKGAQDSVIRRLNSRSRRAYPYRPAEPPQELPTLIGLYDGEILAADAYFGDLVEQLKKRGLYENTLVAVVSDHGEEFFEHGGFGHISHLYQELVKVPWILRFPKDQAAGSRVGGEWQHLDFAPTILRALDLPVAEGMEGFAFDPSSKDEPPKRFIYSHVNVGPDAHRTGQSNQAYSLHMEGVRNGEEVYIECLAHRRNVSPPRALFNLAKDPEQLRNVYSQKPTSVSFMRSKLSELRTLAPLAPVVNVSNKVLNEHLKSLQYLR